MGSPRDPNQPGKFSMRFRTDELGLGFELNLDEVMNGMFGKNFFEFYVLSTDYQNYAVIWNCKRVADDGTCVENVVLVMSRGKKLTPCQDKVGNHLRRLQGARGRASFERQMLKGMVW